jgi:hypothetical protein
VTATIIILTTNLLAACYCGCVARLEKYPFFLAMTAWWSVLRCGNEAEVFLIGLMLPVLYVIRYNERNPIGPDHARHTTR